MKSRDRNKPCPCGSGKKTKKCCRGKSTSHTNQFMGNESMKSHTMDHNKWYEIVYKEFLNHKELLITRDIKTLPTTYGEHPSEPFGDMVWNDYVNKKTPSGLKWYYSLNNELNYFTKIIKYGGLFCHSVLPVNEINEIYGGKMEFVKYCEDNGIDLPMMGSFGITSNFTHLKRDDSLELFVGILDLYQTLLNTYDSLIELDKNGGVKDFRIQTIDIKKTNVWSCYDDLSYKVLEFIEDNYDLLHSCIGGLMMGLFIRKWYQKLGKPNNDIELQNGTIEKLLKKVYNDSELLTGFRLDICGWTQSCKVSDRMIKRDYPKDYKNGKELRKLMKRFFNDVDKINEEKELGIEYDFNRIYDLMEQTDSHERDSMLFDNRISLVYENGFLGEDRLFETEFERPFNPTYDIEWLKKLDDDGMVSIYRSVSDKNHTEGWSWSLNKELTTTWVRGRGLVGTLEKTKSYILETRIPKSEILMIFGNHSTERNTNYGEIVILKESLKNREIKITEVDPHKSDELIDTYINDVKLWKPLVHEETMDLINLVRDSVQRVSQKMRISHSVNDENIMKKYIEMWMRDNYSSWGFSYEK
jgi:hypothetical protein